MPQAFGNESESQVSARIIFDYIRMIKIGNHDVNLFTLNQKALVSLSTGFSKAIMDKKVEVNLCSVLNHTSFHAKTDIQ